MAKIKGYPTTLSDAEWRAKQDLQTLIEAERIKCDPARMKMVRKCAEARKEELVEDLGMVAELQKEE